MLHKLTLNHLGLQVLLAAIIVSPLWAAPEKRGTQDELGKRIYLKQCAHCHGIQGEGVVGFNENPLYGNKRLPELIQVIDETMPEDKPKTCRGDDAVAVGRYIFETFYTPEARASQKPPRIELARLTNRQYVQTIRDIFRNFLGRPELDELRGIKAQYYNGRNFRDRVGEAIVNSIDYDFDQALPYDKLTKKEEFSIKWEGSIIAEESGVYEFIVQSPNSIRLYVNNREDRLIDKYVATNERDAEHKATVFLQGGEAYFFRLETFRFKDPAASMTLSWVPPEELDRSFPNEIFHRP